MASSPSTDYATATRIIPETSHTYTAQLQPDFCIGTVPHGGYITSLFLRTSTLHFTRTLGHLRQPNPITLHLTFLRRTSTGPATFTVRDVKIGRATSVVHITLTQAGHREEVVGYITHSNLSTSTGPSLNTAWSLHPPPLPVSIPDLKTDDANWAEATNLPFSSFRKASNKVRFFLPRKSQPVRGAVDEWVCLRSGERFDDTGVGFIADMFPQVIEALLGGEAGVDDAEARKQTARYWFPTVLLNLEVKKALPREGVEWLFCRARAKVVEGGRYDLEVVILDEGGAVVALSQHVVMVLPAARNLSERKAVEGGKL